MQGWIKLHRQILKWEWYSDLHTRVLFLHLLLKANHQDNRYQGILIKRGQLLSGRRVLASETGLTEQQIRTSLKKLKSTQEITSKSTSKYTLYTIENYNLYQCFEERSTSKTTDEQPTSNQQLTTNKNDKKENNVKKKESALFDTFWNRYPRKRDKLKTKAIFCELSEEDQETAIKGIEAFAFDENFKFIAYASNWLLNRRWEDEEVVAKNQVLDAVCCIEGCNLLYSHTHGIGRDALKFCQNHSYFDYQTDTGAS